LVGFVAGERHERTRWRDRAARYASVQEGESSLDLLVARARQTALGPVDPHPGSQRELARLLMAAGDYATAATELRAYRSVRRLPPKDDARVLWDLAVCEAQIGEREGALKTASEAIKVEPGLRAYAADVPAVEVLLSGRPIGPEAASVVLAYMWDKWGICAPTHQFLNASASDRAPPNMVADAAGLVTGWNVAAVATVLGPGKRLPGYPGTLDGACYALPDGARLIWLRGSSTTYDTVVLSAESHVSGKPARASAVDLVSRWPVGLGDPVGKVVRRLGTPTSTASFRNYDLMWYAWPTETQPAYAQGSPSYEFGYVAAYAVYRSRVVEIYLHRWRYCPATG
jgi:tetratricopeptide (TPR) repeat protein